MENKEPITLLNCQVTTNRTTGKLQVVLKTNYTIDEKASPDIKYSIPDPSTSGSPFVSLTEITN